MQQVIDVDAPGEKKLGVPHPKVKKIVFPYCVVNFARQEDMVSFETEFNKAVKDLKESLEPAAAK